MREWMAGLACPSPEWLPLDVWSPDGAERLAQEISDRGGELNELYAEALYPELKAIRDQAQERDAAPVAVFVPESPGDMRPLVQATAIVVVQESPEAGRTLEAIAAVARAPRSYRLQEPDVREVSLPLGPACRVREMALDGELDDGRELVTEYLTHYVLPPSFPDGVLQLTVTWSVIGLGDVMSEIADEMAASLTLE